MKFDWLCVAQAAQPRDVARALTEIKGAGSFGLAPNRFRR